MKTTDRDRLKKLAWRLGIDAEEYDDFEFSLDERTDALMVPSHDAADTLLAEGGIKFSRQKLGKDVIIY